MRQIDSVVISALEQGNIRWAYLVDVEFDVNPLRFSSLYSDLDYDGKTYIGAGNLGTISATQENSALEPSSVNLTISGVNPAVLPTVFDQEYINRPASIRLLVLDDNGGVVGVLPYYGGLISDLSLNFSSTSSIQISLADQLSVWSREKVSRYTDQDQKTRYPNDRGFEFVEQIQDLEIVWPTKEFFD